MNTATQSSTRISAAFLNFGRYPETVRNLRRERKDRNKLVKIKEDDWLERIKELDALRDLVYKHFNETVDIQRARFNKNRKTFTISSEIEYRENRIIFRMPRRALMRTWNPITMNHIR